MCLANFSGLILREGKSQLRWIAYQPTLFLPSFHFYLLSSIFLILFSFSFTHILQQSPYSLLTFSLNFYHHHNRLFCLSWRSSLLLLLFQFACDNLSSQTVSVCGSATVRERIARKRERARVVCVNVWVLSLLAVLSGQFSIAVRHSSRPSVGERAQDTVGSRHRSVCTGTFVWSGRIRHHHQHRCCPRWKTSFFLFHSLSHFLQSIYLNFLFDSLR